MTGRREIKQLQVRCVNFERGCQWTGTVCILDDHIASCQFVLVPCPNKCEEDKGTGKLLLIRKHLDQHLNTKCPKRAYKCPYCGEKGTFARIAGDHDQVCEKKLVACPNMGKGCLILVERGKTKEHLSKSCEYTEVACVYESLGCGERMLRRDQKIHEKEDGNRHLYLSLTVIMKMSEQLTDTVKLHESLLFLKEEQFKQLSEQHQQLSARHGQLSERHGQLSKQHHQLLEQQEQLSKRQEKLSYGLLLLSAISITIVAIIFISYR